MILHSGPDCKRHSLKYGIHYHLMPQIVLVSEQEVDVKAWSAYW